MSSKNSEGFTLIEVLIVLAILVVVFGTSAVSGVNFYNGQALIAERDTLVSLLRDARGRALDNMNQSSHGVYVGTNQYVVFDGSSYAARSQDYDTAFPRYPGVAVSGPGEIVFNALDGGSNVSGTINIASGSGSINISVNSEGRINW